MDRFPAPSSTLSRRRSSTSTFPSGNASSQLPLDLELIYFKSPSSTTYTSLKDLIPSSSTAAINSPTATAANSGSEISIRNRLVKQAAWAYLQPMASSPNSSSSPNCFRRLWLRLKFCLIRIIGVLGIYSSQF